MSDRSKKTKAELIEELESQDNQIKGLKGNLKGMNKKPKVDPACVYNEALRVRRDNPLPAYEDDEGMSVSARVEDNGNLTITAGVPMLRRVVTVNAARVPGFLAWCAELAGPQPQVIERDRYITPAGMKLVDEDAIEAKLWDRVNTLETVRNALIGAWLVCAFGAAMYAWVLL